MSSKQEFLERELAWVRIVRKTTKPTQLHLVEPAVQREREILAEIDRIEHEAEPLLADQRKAS